MNYITSMVQLQVEAEKSEEGVKEKGHWKKRARKTSIDRESKELKGKEGS